MYNKPLSLFIVLILAFVCVFAPATSNAQAAVRCGPQPGLSTCNPTPECEGIVRKAHTPGCRRPNGKPFNDGGCQCKGYCGYKCASACQMDPECRWNNREKECYNVATGKAGRSLKICAATNSPVMTTSPTNIPTSSPTPQPSKSPREHPTKQPTVQGFCVHDDKFPGREMDPFDTRTIAMSSNGNVVLFAHSSWVGKDDTNDQEYEYEYEMTLRIPLTTLYLTKRNVNNGNWVLQEVGRYENVSSIKEGAMSDNGAYIVFFLQPDTASEYVTNANRKAVFVKRQPNGQYKRLTSFPFEINAYGIYPTFWMNAAGTAVIVSYTGLLQGPLYRFTKTKTFTRQKNTWRLANTQNDVLLQDFSRDGKSAYSQYEDDRTQYKYKRIYFLENKKWVLVNSDLIGAGSPQPKFQGTTYSGFSSNGKYFIMGSDILQYFPGSDYVPDDSGAFVFVRMNGNYTQEGPKLGGGNLLEGAFTGISDDFKTIMSSSGGGFKIYKKSNDTWTEVGFTKTDAFGAKLNAKGNRVVTIWPITAWTC